MGSQFSSSGPPHSDWERSRYEGEQQSPDGNEGNSEPEYQAQSGRYDGEGSQQGGWGGNRQDAYPSYSPGSGQFRSGRQSASGGYEKQESGRTEGAAEPLRHGRWFSGASQ